MEQTVGDQSWKGPQHHLLQRWQKGVTLHASTNPLVFAARVTALEKLLRSYLNSAEKSTVID